MDPDQALWIVGPDQGPKCLTFWQYFWKIFFKKLILKKINRRQKSTKNYQVCNELMLVLINTRFKYCCICWKVNHNFSSSKYDLDDPMSHDTRIVTLGFLTVGITTAEDDYILRGLKISDLGSSIRGPVIDQKYACFINFPSNMHFRIHCCIPLWSLNLPVFYSISVCDVIDSCTWWRHLNTPAIHVVRIRVRVTSDRSPSFLEQRLDFFENLCTFTKSNYYVSLPMEQNLEIFRDMKNKKPKDDRV